MGIELKFLFISLGLDCIVSFFILVGIRYFFRKIKIVHLNSIKFGPITIKNLIPADEEVRIIKVY